MQWLVKYIFTFSIWLSLGLAMTLYAQTDEQKMDAYLLSAKAAKSTEEKSRVFCQIADLLLEIDKVKALQYAQQAHQMLPTNPTEAQTNALIFLGKTKYANEKVQEAQTHLQTALSQAQSLQKQSLEVDALNALANIDIRQNRKRAYEYLAKSLKISEQVAYTQGQADAYEVFGDWLLGENPSEAISQYQRAYNLYRAENLPEKRVLMLQKIANTHLLYRNDYPAAIRNLQEAIKISEILKNQRLLAENLNQIANVHFLHLQDYKTALKYYFQSYVLTQEYEFASNGNTLSTSIKGIANCYASLARLTRNQGYESKAEEYEQLFATYQQSYRDLDNIQRNVAQFRRQQESQSQRRYTMASPNATSAETEEKAELKRKIDLKAENIDRLARDNKISPLKEAELKAELKLEEDNLSLSLNQKESEISLLQREKEQKESQIDVLSRESTQKNKHLQKISTSQNIWLVVLLSMSALFLMGLLFVNYSKNKVINQRKSQVNEKQTLINRQEILLREKEKNIHEGQTKLAKAHLELDEAKLENRLLVDLLNREIIPPMKLLFSQSTENLLTPQVLQQGQQIIHLLQGVYRFENLPAQLDLQTASFSLFKVARRAFQSCEALMLDKKIQINNQIRPYFFVEVDEFYIEELFTTLFYNSLKYAPEGSNIHIESELIRQDGKRWIQTTFTDQGRNIPANMAQSIFEKYNPEEARPLVHSFPYIQKIIQSHGGQAFVRPEYKEGLSFVFTLPETTESEI